MWRLWFISSQSHWEQKCGEFLGRAYASKSYCVQPLYWFCYCLSIIECSSEKQNEINKNNHVPRKYFLIVRLVLSLSRLLDLSADTPVSGRLRQSFNSCFAKRDFKNKLSNFCTKSALFTIGQVKQKAPFSGFQHIRDDAVLLIFSTLPQKC